MPSLKKSENRNEQTKLAWTHFGILTCLSTVARYFVLASDVLLNQHPTGEKKIEVDFQFLKCFNLFNFSLICFQHAEVFISTMKLCLPNLGYQQKNIWTMWNWNLVIIICLSLNVLSSILMLQQLYEIEQLVFLLFLSVTLRFLGG